MNLQEIWETFALMSQLEEEEKERWLPLCAAAADEIQSELRGPVRDSSDNRRVNRAAAALAFYRYCLCQSTGEMQSFQAGDVRVSGGMTSATSALAYDLWRQARAGIANLLNDREFAFSRVVP